MTNGQAHIRMHGGLSVSDMRAIVLELDLIERQVQVTPQRLVDISEVTNVSVDFKAVHDVAESRAAVRLRNAIKTAIVAPTMVQYGCARMFELLNQQRQTEVMVFRDRASALDWLKDGTVGDGKQV